MFTKLVCTKSFKNRDDGHQLQKWALMPLMNIIKASFISWWCCSDSQIKFVGCWCWNNFCLNKVRRGIMRKLSHCFKYEANIWWMKIFQLRCCQTPDPDLNQCILMLADECSWGEEKVDIMIICIQPKIPQLDTWGPKCPAKTKYCDIQVTSVTHTDNTCNFFANYRVIVSTDTKTFANIFH